MPRNRELMHMFRDLDLVEQLDTRVYRILMAYNRNIFKVSDNFLEICFPFEQDYIKARELETNRTNRISSKSLSNSGGKLAERRRIPADCNEQETVVLEDLVVKGKIKSK